MNIKKNSGKIAVFHFSDCYYPRINGVTSAIDSISSSQIKSGVLPIIIAPNYKTLSQKKLQKGSSVKIIRLDAVSLRFSREDSFILINKKNINAVLGETEKLLSEGHKIIFHLHNIFNASVIAFKVKKIIYQKRKIRIPVVLTYHTIWENYLHYLPLPEFLSKILLKRRTIYVLKRCNFVIAPDKSVASYLKNYGYDNKSRTVILPSPADKIFFQKNKSLNGILKKFKIKKNNYFMYAGRLSREKNIYFLIDIFNEMKKLSDKKHKLIICGEGPERNNLMLYARKMGIGSSIIFTGYLRKNDLKFLYCNCEGLLFTSKTETQGLVVIEAMSQGALTFLPDAPPFNNIINNNKNGFLLKENAPNLFAMRMLEILNNKKICSTVRKNSIKSARKYNPHAYMIAVNIVYQKNLK